MISEKCSCGASIEVDYKYESNERSAVEEWRSSHKHDWKSSITQPWTQRYGSGTATAGIGAYALNEDFVIATNGEPCWIGKGTVPEDWDEWATAFRKNYYIIPDPPEPTAKPGKR